MVRVKRVGRGACFDDRHSGVGRCRPEGLARKTRWARAQGRVGRPGGPAWD